MAEEKLLILSCCAPCSCGVIQKLAAQGRKFTVLFYNPNIDGETEYQKRLAENKRVCGGGGGAFARRRWKREVVRQAVRGVEGERARGRRCSGCFARRRRRGARYAKDHGFTAFSWVLGISRHKDLDQVNAAAQQAAQQEDIPYDLTNWRKGGTEQLRSALIKEMQIYNQTYCGCVYSRRTVKDEKSA